jgi:RNA-directed DNA polymerase
MRQNIQLDLALPETPTGEARSIGGKGAEAAAAGAVTESQAVHGPSMEAIVERDNLRKALAQVRRNKGCLASTG